MLLLERRHVEEADQPGTLKELLKKLRLARRADERGLKDVAGKVGVSFQAVQRWETGIDRPSVTRMRKWLAAVDLPASWARLYEGLLVIEQIDKKLEPLVDEDARKVVATVVRGVIRDRPESD